MESRRNVHRREFLEEKLASVGKKDLRNAGVVSAIVAAERVGSELGGGKHAAILADV